MDPYKVLGVDEGATDAEIRKAYLELVKKYHPDKFTDNPLCELAEEKLKEINEAYEMLTKRKNDNTARSDSSWSNSYSGSGSSYSGPNSREFGRIASCISAGDYSRAKALLDEMSLRNAYWHYLYGIVMLNMNSHDEAARHFETAYSMEPGNMNYRNAYNSMFSSRGNYRSGTNAGNSNNSGCSACDICSCLICSDCCCECMGGDLISCC